MSKNSVKSALRASFRVLSNFRYFKNPQIYLCNFDPNVFFFEKLFFSKSNLFFTFSLLKTSSHWRPFFAVFANYALKFDLFSRKWPQILRQNPILVIFNRLCHLLVNFGQFDGKKSILTWKSSKNINVQKWCQNGSKAII